MKITKYRTEFIIFMSLKSNKAVIKTRNKKKKLIFKTDLQRYIVYLIEKFNYRKNLYYREN